MMKTPKTTPEPAEVLYFDEYGANRAFQAADLICQKFNEMLTAYGNLGLPKFKPADMDILRRIHYGGGEKPLIEKMRNDLILDLADTHQLVKEKAIQQFFERADVKTTIKQAEFLKRGFYLHTDLSWNSFSLEKGGLLTVTGEAKERAKVEQFTSYVDTPGKAEYLKLAESISKGIQGLQKLESGLVNAWDLSEYFGRFQELFVCDGEKIELDRAHLHKLKI